MLDPFLPCDYECVYARNGLVIEIRPSVSMSVCPSVKRVHCDKTNNLLPHYFIPYEKSIRVVFYHEEQLAGKDPLALYRKFLGSN